MKGLFITFEGLDGCGKTTQAFLLKEFFENKDYAIYLTREPGGTKVGERVREILLDPNYVLNPWSEVFLYLVSRVENSQNIKEKIQNGIFVICERYADSTIAYQGYGRGLPINMLVNFNKIATLGLVPDITFLIDIAPEVSLRRKKEFDRIERESLEFYSKVRKGYLALAEENKERFVIISGDAPEKEIFEKVSFFVEKKIKEVERER